MQNYVNNTYEELLDKELEQAPPNFLFAIQSLSNGNINTSIDVLQNAIKDFEINGSYWTGPAYCCLAYCYRQLGYWKEAIGIANKGEKFGLSISGYWYYHDVIVNAMNFIDRVDEALINARDAIRFYRERNSPWNTAYFLSSKSNILKQLASMASKDLSTYEEAKKYAIEAIESIIESYFLFSSDYQESKEDLNALSNIAARVGVVADDLKSIYGFDNVQAIVSEYFTPKILIEKAVSENFNKAVDSIKKNDRKMATIFFERAYQVAPEDTEENRGFKALICYQCGVNLLYLYKLDQRISKEIYTLGQINTIKQIQKYWNETIILYNALNSEFIEEFDKRLAPGLRSAVRNINLDSIMKIN